MSCAATVVALDAAGERLEQPNDAFEEGRFARAVRADHGYERAARDLAVEMMHGGMPVIAERNVAKLQGAAHRPTSWPR